VNGYGLREREFRAGRFRTLGGGNVLASIEVVVEQAGPDGTRSILDIEKIGTEMECCQACVLSEETLEELFETPRPTREDVLKEGTMYGIIDRGQALCFAVYNLAGEPSEICFAGYSFD
jgi:hypothetical protein